MVKLENFKDLTIKQENLLKKNYSFGSVGLLNLNIKNNDLTFHSRISEKADKGPLASASLEYKNDFISLKGKKRNDTFSYYKLEVTPNKVIKDFKAVLDCKILKSDSFVDSSVAVEYKHEKFLGKLAYLTQTNVVNAQVTIGKPEYGVGFDGKLDVGTKQLAGLTTALWWFKKNSRLVFKHIGTNAELFALGNFELSYYQKISPLAHIGSKVSTNWKSKVTEIEVGGDYKFDRNTLIKGKINSEGNIGLSFARSLSSQLKATIATEINTDNLVRHSSKGYKLGVRFDFNS